MNNYAETNVKDIKGNNRIRDTCIYYYKRKVVLRQNCFLDLCCII